MNNQSNTLSKQKIQDKLKTMEASKKEQSRWTSNNWSNFLSREKMKGGTNWCFKPIKERKYQNQYAAEL